MFSQRTLLILFALAAYIECSAQKNIPVEADTTQYWLIQTNDDNEFIGKILGVESGVLMLATEKFGVLKIQMADVTSMKEVESLGTEDGEPQLRKGNFHGTRGFLLPNGFGLRPREAYYQNVWVLFNQFSVGITKNFSISAGTIPIYLFGAGSIPLWIAPKVSIPLGKKVNLGVGVLYGYAIAVDYNQGDGGGGGGVGYGVMTFGSRDRNASIGVGFGLGGESFSQRPVVTFSTMNRLSGGSYIVTETYLLGGIADSDALGLFSMAWRKRIKNTCLDVGGLIPLVSDGRTILLPILGVSVPLGKGGR